MPVIKKITNAASIAGAINYADSTHVRKETIEWLEKSGADPELIELAKKSRAIFKDGVNCDPENSKQQMIDTRKYFGHVGYKNQASRTTVSFSKDEVDPTKPDQLLHALDYVVAVIKKAYPNYESHLALHIDGESHMAHVHVVTSKVNLETGKIMNFAYGEQQELLRSINDAMCADYGYSVPEKTSTLAPERYTVKELKSIEENKYDPRVYIKQRLDEALLDPDVQGMDAVQAAIEKPQQSPYVQPDATGEQKQDRLAIEVRPNSKGVLTYVVHHLDVESTRKRKAGTPAKEWVERVHASTLGDVYTIKEMTDYLYGKVETNELQRQVAQRKAIERTITDQRSAVEPNRGRSDQQFDQQSSHDEADNGSSEPTNETRNDSGTDQPVIDSVTVAEIIATSDDAISADGDHKTTQNGRVEESNYEFAASKNDHEQFNRDIESGRNERGRGAEITQRNVQRDQAASDAGKSNVRVWPTFDGNRQRRATSFDGSEQHLWEIDDDFEHARKQQAAFSEFTGRVKREADRITKHVGESLADHLKDLRAHVQLAALAIVDFVKSRKQREKDRADKAKADRNEYTSTDKSWINDEAKETKRQNSWQILRDKTMPLREKYDYIRNAYDQPRVNDLEFDRVKSVHDKYRKLPRPFKLTFTIGRWGERIPTGEYGAVTLNHAQLVARGLAPELPDEEIGKRENKKRGDEKRKAWNNFKVALVGPDATGGSGSGGQPAREISGKDSPQRNVATPENTSVVETPSHDAELEPEQDSPRNSPADD